MQAHSWETSEHAWELGDPASGRMDGLGLLADLGGDDVDPGDMSPEEQADEFVAMLISLKSRNKLSAKDIAIFFCLVIAWAYSPRTRLEGMATWA